MTNPNSQPPRDERQDELIASVVAFAAIGTVLFLGLGRLGGNQVFSTQRIEGNGRSRQPEESLFGFLQQPDRNELDGDERDSNDQRGTAAGSADEAAPRRAESDREARRELDAVEQANRQDFRARRPRSTGSIPPAIIAVPDSVEDVEVPVSAADVDGDAAEVPADEAPAATALPENEAPAGEPVEETPPELTDVSSNYWAAPFINRLGEEGIVAGFNDNTFRPDEPVTRAQFAAQLAQAFASQTPNETASYTDVDADYWAADPIQQVSNANFMSGYPEGNFLPGESVTRLEVLISLASGLELSEPGAPQELLSVYTDQNQIPEWAIPKIAAATENELAVNHPEPSTLNPSQPATRAETAAMIYQALVQQGQLAPVESTYIVSPE
ncbi:MAG: S-layer homology domain-containing protein [Elainellaceae cyanobacterium]